MNSNDNVRKANTATHSNDLSNASAASLLLLGKRASPETSTLSKKKAKAQVAAADTISDDDSSLESDDDDCDEVDEDGNKRERRYVALHYLKFLTYSNIACPAHLRSKDGTMSVYWIYLEI